MAGSFDFTPSAIPLGRPAAVIAVFRYDGEGGYELLPNVRCLQIQFREGAEPGSARFRYAFDDPLGSPDDPQRFEQVYPLDASGPNVVSNDDRLVVRRLLDDGSDEVLFDGFASIPQADLGPETETVSFVALDTPIREWDKPLGGALMRDADNPLTDSNIQTDLPARFNPDGHPNGSPKDADSNNTIVNYPVFLGPVWPSNTINSQTIRPWTLDMAVRYVLAQGNPKQEWTQIPFELRAPGGLLVAYHPTDGTGPIDYDDPSTYTSEDIIVQDYDVTGEAWPVAIQRLIEPHGFGMQFVLSTDDNGDPEWSLEVYRKDDESRIKSLYLQEAGNTLDPGQTNVGQMSLARDAHEIANAITIDAKPLQIEASFVLAPGFHVAAGDKATPAKYVGENAPDDYRMFIFDECGEGFWGFTTSSWITGQPGELKTLLTQGAKTRQYVKRRRPGKATLVTTDSDGKPKRAQLHVANAYVGKSSPPCVWDGSAGTWQEVNSSDWKLLPDRLGIKITCDDPNKFAIGKPSDGTPKVFGKVLRLLDWISNPTADQPAPIFRLTCVIEADQDFAVTAPTRSVSPTSYTIERRVDCRDRFKKTIVSKYSALADPANVGIKDVAKTDDTDEAQALADGIRRAREAGVFAGSVTIPRITTAYGVGDKIDEIDGRGVSLRSNVGAGTGESPVYPVVVGVTWSFDGQQSTTLELSDRRGEPPPKHREAKDD